MGAMQSQDYASGTWSLGLRIAGCTLVEVESAFERGEVIRTWPMRGTIHTIDARDASWLLALTGIRALDASRTRRAQLGLDSSTVERAADILADELAGRRRLTRTEALATLREHGIATDGQRGYHLLGYAAQTGRICIGPQDGKEQTFVQLDTWAPEQRRLDREAALSELTFRFFRSHGPASVRDFAGWSGLTLTDVRAGIGANDGRLAPVHAEGQQLWASTEIADALWAGDIGPLRSAVAPPGFDEFILGYKDRDYQVPAGRLPDIVPGGNGVFRATVCIDGQAVGTWTRTRGRHVVRIAYTPFDPPASPAAASRAFAAYGAFLGLDVELL
jgi:hypothetical protein